MRAYLAPNTRIASRRLRRRDYIPVWKRRYRDGRRPWFIVNPIHGPRLPLIVALLRLRRESATLDRIEAFENKWFRQEANG